MDVFGSVHSLPVDCQSPGLDREGGPRAAPSMSYLSVGGIGRNKLANHVDPVCCQVLIGSCGEY